MSLSAITRTAHTFSRYCSRPLRRASSCCSLNLFVKWLSFNCWGKSEACRGLREGPLPGQLWEVEADELLLEAVVQVDELAVPAGRQVPACHVDVEHDKLVVLLLAHPVVGDGDGQGALLRVVYVRVAGGLFVGLQTFRLL